MGWPATRIIFGHSQIKQFKEGHRTFVVCVVNKIAMRTTTKKPYRFLGINDAREGVKKRECMAALRDRRADGLNHEFREF